MRASCFLKDPGLTDRHDAGTVLTDTVFVEKGGEQKMLVFQPKKIGRVSDPGNEIGCFKWVECRQGQGFLDDVFLEDVGFIV